MMNKQIFDSQCRLCPRLANFLDDVKQKYPDYHARPVAPFGDANAKLLVVGLAPGMHGANATGRPFTGDYAGILLYEALYEFGYSNQVLSESLHDGLVLKNCRISNAVKCLPPQNKPTGDEVNQCNSFLAAELATLPEDAVILALGTVAHQAVLKALGLKASSAKFAHNVQHALSDGRVLVDSYHTSRYNVQTKRLTKAGFTDVFQRIGLMLG
ncbi:MAG: uracil-DNA glycosylase [Methylococcaceae bacterium]|nr:uracil-DNA glycosylase [Methylococcaceae bacterium]